MFHEIPPSNAIYLWSPGKNFIFDAKQSFFSTPKSTIIVLTVFLPSFIDVCVFLRTTMEPVLAIDLFSPSPVEQQMKKLHPNVIKAMQAVKIPLIQFQIAEEYNLIELRTRVIDAMPSKIVAMLKDKVKNDINF